MAFPFVPKNFRFSPINFFITHQINFDLQAFKALQASKDL
jgi:hypothetical protein